MKKGWEPWPARDGPSADVAGNPCVRPPEESPAVAHLAVSVFAVRFARTPRRGIRFRCLSHPCRSPPPLGFPFSFCFFFLRRFFSPLPPLLFPPPYFVPFSPWLSASGAFSLTRPWMPSPPPVRARVSGLRLFLVYRFPFFVKVSDTLIRCVVLFPFLHRDCCFARSRCNYLYLSSFDNVL